MKREEDEDGKKGLADARDNESLEEKARSISVTRKVRSDSAATLTVHAPLLLFKGGWLRKVGWFSFPFSVGPSSAPARL